MVSANNIFRIIAAASFLSLLSGCKNAQTASGGGDRSAIKILGYADEDAPVGTVMVTTIGGGAPAVILAQEKDPQTEDQQPVSNSKNIELADDEKLTFDSLFVFRRNSYAITPAMEDNLLKVTRILKRHQDASVFIEGYVDVAKDKNHHYTLSEKRAKAIADYLVHHAIKPNRIQRKGYTDTQPLFSNKTTQGKVKNRRVEVSVIARSENETKNSRK
jgi:outer membrane protein OmpA-like peptidoglycan-associated protein